jgi:D-sedoheptulose 7-phosphate isomerase
MPRQTLAIRQTAGDFLRDFTSLLREIDLDEVEQAFSMLQEARDRGATVYLAGNGGSASTASHWANDLGKGAKRADRRPFRVMSLSDNVSWLTALANDEGYERSFSGQLENFAAPGDVLVVISASGNSPNLVRAVELAKSLRVKTLGLLGFDGGALKKSVDRAVWLRSPRGAYGLVESGHALMCHLLTACLAQDRAFAEPSLKAATA